MQVLLVDEMWRVMCRLVIGASPGAGQPRMGDLSPGPSPAP
jgi:hypothetical protein